MQIPSLPIYRLTVSVSLWQFEKARASVTQITRIIQCLSKVELIQSVTFFVG